MQDCGWWLTVTLRLRITDDGGVAAARRTMCCGVTAAFRLLPSAGARQVRMSDGCAAATALRRSDDDGRLLAFSRNC